MKIYARIQDGKVAEIVKPMAGDDGKEIAIEDRFHPDIVATLVDVTGIDGVAVGWIYDGREVSAPPGPALADLKKDQIAKIQSDCTAAIYAGFTSSALGAPHLYPAKDKDQVNLNASVTSSLLPPLPADWTTPFWCADEVGNWAYVEHTAAQIQQVGRDGKSAILANLTKCQAYIDQINAATTAAAVDAVVWE